MADDTIYEGKGWTSFHAPTATALSQLDKIEQICSYGDKESQDSLKSRGEEIIIAIVHFIRLCEEAQHATWQDPSNTEYKETTNNIEDSIKTLESACQTISPNSSKDTLENALDTCFKQAGRLKDDLLTQEEILS